MINKLLQSLGVMKYTVHYDICHIKCFSARCFSVGQSAFLIQVKILPIKRISQIFLSCLEAIKEIMLQV